MRHRLWALFDRIAFALLLGTISNVLIEVPPQHGKSQYWSKYFPAWWLKHNPEHRIILGSYAAGYAASWGREARDVVTANGDLIASEQVPLQPENLEVRDDVAAASEWKLVGHEGGMITSGVEGGIAGRPAELVLVDDPIKDAATARSKTEKDKIWKWWEEEASARLQKNGRRVMLMTRRAEDDPIGRIRELIKAGKEKWCIVRLPALCEEDDELKDAKDDEGNPIAPNWDRKVGEALVPELHDEKELLATKAARGSNTWAGLYQQRPYPEGGGAMSGSWFKTFEGNLPIRRYVRAWDLAASEDPKAKQTAGVKIGEYLVGTDLTKDRRYHVAHVEAFRKKPGSRNAKIVETAKADGPGVRIILEQEPGSGGPAQCEELVRMLAGFTVTIVSAATEGSKELRAEGFGAAAELGNVTLAPAPWNLDFRAEADSFPAGLIDMIDAGAHGYNYLASTKPVIIPAGYTGLAVPGQRLFGTGRPRV